MSKLNDLVCKFHDANLYAIHSEIDAKIIRCNFFICDGKKVSLTMRGVDEFRCDDFGLQNIVWDIVSTVWGRITEEDLKSYIEWIFRDSEWEERMIKKNVDLTLKKIISNELHCIFLIPSCGAQLAAIAQEIELMVE